jgi:hypothetical protein
VCRTTAKLTQAQSILAETEDVGINVIDNLQQQREGLIRTQDKVRRELFSIHCVPGGMSFGYSYLCSSVGGGFSLSRRIVFTFLYVPPPLFHPSLSAGYERELTDGAG